MIIRTRFYKCILCFKIIFICYVAAITEPNSQVEVRAVFIKCEPDERQTLSLDNEVARFEREEQYKHSALRDCNKKIAVTVKIASEPDMNADDEFIPIEHVLQGSRRIRLLDPYVMRLRREQPLQAYKLKKIDIVSGILTYTEDSITRYQRSSDIITSEPRMDYLNSSYSSLHNLEHVAGTTQKQIVRNYDISDAKTCSNKRYKRNVHNTMVEIITEQNSVQRKREEPLEIDKHLYTEKTDNFKRNNPLNMDANRNVNREQPTIIGNVSSRSKKDDKYGNDKIKHLNFPRNEQDDKIRTKKYYKNMKKSELPLIVYEIDKPDIWSTVHIQLFEKLSTPEGKTVWNDLSKGELASVSSLAPEWSDEDLNVRYRAEWIPKGNFSLPTTRMCLLTPQDKYYRDTDEENLDTLKYGDYIVVPKEDIVTLNNTKIIQKKNLENYSDDQSANQFRRVMVRMSRALVDSKADKMSVAAHRGNQFLTMPYGGTHQAQIDLEARADENELVNVGSSGRIMTIVSDNTRRTRTIMNVQIMNTGLMAAHFSIKPRDCGPEYYGDESGTEKVNDDSILLPPRHTRYVRLILPNEIPSENTRCSVALIGDEGHSVAVRDVTIKRGDRCYCVWHCECVCLSEDPRLICEEMPDSRQVAAGLSLRERPRHARSVCYQDAPSVNVIVIFFGVLLVLFILGFIKGILGLIFPIIGTWGMDKIVEMPRHLSRYYESSLQKICVVYDDEGWPIHPFTKKRTVQLVSKSMQFLLNLVFFIVYPCRLVYDILKQICAIIKKQKGPKYDYDQARTPKQCESDDMLSGGPKDMQAPSRIRRRKRRRRNHLRRWMTSEADELSTYLWQKGLLIDQCSNNTSMRPLIIDDTGLNKKLKIEPLNSDEDDTEFVLTQMKKSRESLAKSQKGQNGGISSGKQQQLLYDKGTSKTPAE